MSSETSRKPFQDTLAWIVPNATVFVSSACIMVLELVAGRLVARHLGASLYTWTSAIGVFLAGIAIGNYVGGRLADRFPARKTLSTLFILASATSILVSVLDNLLGGWFWPHRLSYPLRVAVHVTLVFLLPSALLGTISPVVAKMALDLGRKTGRTIGSIYAWGMVGSIVGTFATGYFLIAAFGTIAITYATAALLAFIAVLFGGRAWRPWAWSAVLAALVILSTTSRSSGRAAGEALSLRNPGDPNLIYSDETQYSYLAVYRDPDLPMKRYLMLDRLLHGIIQVDDPRVLHYDYEQIYAAVTRLLAGPTKQVRTLTVGGGGYGFPRYLLATRPGSLTEAAEIDPGVTLAAVKALGLEEGGPLVIHHQDGRVFVDDLMRVPSGERPAYDFIYCDAFSHVAVPFQLTTVEFNRNVASLLAPGGAYLIHLIDIFSKGEFLSSVLKTMEAAFPHVSVYAMKESYNLNLLWHRTFVLVGTRRPLEADVLCSDDGRRCDIARLDDALMGQLRTRKAALLLTDDFAPVDNLLAGVAESHFASNEAPFLLRSARGRLQRGDIEGGLRDCDFALRLTRTPVETQIEVGGVLAAHGLFEQAEGLLRDAAAKNPYSDKLHVAMADLYARQENYERAVDHLATALTLDPQSEAAMAQLNRLLPRAVVAAEQALRSNPDDGRTHQLLANYYYFAREYRLALAHADRAAELGARVSGKLERYLEKHRPGAPPGDHPTATDTTRESP